jgi:GMP synthase (glutamine-hydrolysing)
MLVHFIIHEAFEAPGAYEQWAIMRGHQRRYSRVYLNEKLPQSVDGIDMLVVMGGPQSPSTTKDQCPYFDADSEIKLIKKCIDANVIVVGVCLGAQLIGMSLNAQYEPSPEKEIGKFPIKITAKGKKHPLFIDFGDALEVGHWHSDMPGLTKDSTIIAYSDGCPRQIVQYGPAVFGFQCHMEFNREIVNLLIQADTGLTELIEHPFVQQADTLRSHDFSEMNNVLFKFLDKLA